MAVQRLLIVLLMMMVTVTMGRMGMLMYDDVAVVAEVHADSNVDVVVAGAPVAVAVVADDVPISGYRNFHSSNQQAKFR